MPSPKPNNQRPPTRSQRPSSKQQTKAESVFLAPTLESNYLQFLLNSRYDMDESIVSRIQRTNAMQYLERSCELWAQQIAIQNGYEPGSTNLFQLVLFGSYRLQVHFAHTDIDAICVFRKDAVQRSEFFDSFYAMIDKDPQFQLVSLVNQARVPIIKCVINSIHFDLLFASVDEPNKIHQKLQSDNDEWFSKLSEQN